MKVALFLFSFPLFLVGCASTGPPSPNPSAQATAPVFSPTQAGPALVPVPTLVPPTATPTPALTRTSTPAPIQNPKPLSDAQTIDTIGTLIEQTSETNQLVQIQFELDGKIQEAQNQLRDVGYISALGLLKTAANAKGGGLPYSGYIQSAQSSVRGTNKSAFNELVERGSR